MKSFWWTTILIHSKMSSVFIQSRASLPVFLQMLANLIFIIHIKDSSVIIFQLHCLAYILGAATEIGRLSRTLSVPLNTTQSKQDQSQLTKKCQQMNFHLISSTFRPLSRVEPTFNTILILLAPKNNIGYINIKRLLQKKWKIMSYKNPYTSVFC